MKVSLQLVSVLFCLLLAVHSLAWGAAPALRKVPAQHTVKSKAKPESKSAATDRRLSGIAGHGSAKGAAKGKKARIPRTLRTVPVSAAFRESAVARVQANLTFTASIALVNGESLRPFFTALAAEQAERGASMATAFSRTVRILQFGDSHTAADIFTGEMRSQIQQQFGDGGLGFQFPGHPFPGYHLAGSSRSQTSGWFTEGNRFTQLGNGDLGLGGISIATTLPGQAIILQTPCDSLQLHFLRQSGGGRLQFTDNGTPISVIETAYAPVVETDEPSAPSTSSQAGTFSYACTSGPHELQFTTLDHAPVKLLGIVTEQPGVTWECLGINGAVAPLMLRWSQTLFTHYLRQRAPSLIVLAYGTNEAGNSAEHLETYPADLARILDTLHRNTPEAAILILGPADRAVSSGRGHRASWHPLTGTTRIIAMQKEACLTHGCAFWDTRQRMGGLGSMPQWVAAGWAQPDRVHLTGMGYRALADALYADLIRRYNLNQQHPETTTSKPLEP